MGFRCCSGHAHPAVLIKERTTGKVLKTELALRGPVVLVLVVATVWLLVEAREDAGKVHDVLVVIRRNGLAAPYRKPTAFASMTSIKVIGVFRVWGLG